METITIKMKPELVRYLYVRYAQQPQLIQLPPNSSLYRLIGEMTVKQPANAPRQRVGNITLAIPAPKDGKDPKVFNYLSVKSIRHLERMVRNQMKMELFEEMMDHKMNQGVTYIRTLTDYLERYGMENYVSEESLMRLFQMWKKKREND